METIKNLRVAVTYTVDMSDVEMDDSVYEEIEHSLDSCTDISFDSSSSYPNAFDWLAVNINEANAIELKYEFDQFKVR